MRDIKEAAQRRDGREGERERERGARKGMVMVWKREEVATKGTVSTYLS